jgi:hypothetical protein
MFKLKRVLRVGFLGYPSEGKLTLKLMSRPPRLSRIQLWKSESRGELRS